MIYKQDSFLGGLNRQFDPTKIGENEYPLLINGRIRNDQVETIQLPQEITLGLPEGNIFQGIYSAGTFLIAFIDGLAYYRNFQGSDTSFHQVVGFQMDDLVDRIYMDLVPGSTVNFKRKLINAGNVKEGVNLTQVIGGSPDCAIVCDGIGQPSIIFPDATTRQTQTWEQWVDTDDGSLREYVPIGTFPCYSDGILYMAMKDPSTQQRYNRIGRSVTGRPLDFLIAVDQSGQKLTPKSQSSADVLAHRVDFNTITSINRIAFVENPQNSSTPSPSFLVSTAYSSYLVTPDFTNPIYGEPQFRQRTLFSTAALNPFCVIDTIKGDTLLIDANGIVSFNAALFAKEEGRNLPFSRRIYKLFEGVQQSVACCAKLGNYIHFGVNTVYGPAVVIWDEINETWVSVDIYPGISLIKQFAVISTSTIKRLFFITTDNKLYEAYASNNTATCRAYVGDWSETFNQTVLRSQVAFKDVEISGYVGATLYTDGMKVAKVVQSLTSNINQPSTTIDVPFGQEDVQRVKNRTFGFLNGPKGYKHGILLEWNAKATLSSADVVTSQQDPIINPEQDSLIQQEGTTLNDPLKLLFVGWLGLAGSFQTSMVRLIKDQEPDFIILNGNQNLPSGDISTLQDNVIDYWDDLNDKRKIINVVGEADYTTLKSQATLNYFRQSRYGKFSLNSNVDLFVINSNVGEPDGTSSTSIQALWLKQQLANSQARFKIVCMFSVLDWPFKRWGATMVISAINKFYERIMVEQLTYLTVGTGSETSVDEGFLILTVDNLDIEGQFIKSTLEVQDSFKLLG